MLKNVFSSMFGSVDDDTHIIINEKNGLVSIARICVIGGKVTTIGKWQKELDERAEKMGIDLGSEDLVSLDFLQDGVAQFEYTRSPGEFIPHKRSSGCSNMRATA